jgi:Domain of unknown function (DUF4294)
LKYLLLFLAFPLYGQTIATGAIQPQQGGGFVVPAMILPNGDTIAIIELREFTISAPKAFMSAEDYKRYERYKYYAPTVVAYAAEAVKTYRAMESATREMKGKDRQKYIDKLSDQMNEKFKFQMKNLTKTQGLLMIKMIEKELHMPFYDLVKDIKGGFAAMYWNQFAKLYDYRLKDGYTRGQDPIMDSVLDQFNITYSFK